MSASPSSPTRDLTEVARDQEREERKALARAKHEKTLIRHAEKKKRKLIEKGHTPEEADIIMEKKRQKKIRARYGNDAKDGKGEDEDEPQEEKEKVIPAIPQQKLYSLRPNLDTISLITSRAVSSVFSSSFDRLRGAIGKRAQTLVEKVKNKDIELEPPAPVIVPLSHLLLSAKQRHLMSMNPEKYQHLINPQAHAEARKAAKAETTEDIKDAAEEKKKAKLVKKLAQLGEKQDKMANHLRERLDAVEQKKADLMSKLKGQTSGANNSGQERASVTYYGEQGIENDGWDNECTNVASLSDNIPADDERAITAFFQRMAEAQAAEKMSKKARAKEFAEPSPATYWFNYSPSLIASYEWTEQQALDRSTEKALAHDINKRLSVPAKEAPVFVKPTLPLERVLKPNWQPVDKSPIAAVLMTILLARADYLSAPGPVTFIGFRHSIRHLVLGQQDCRIDVQKYGRFIFMRRYTDYYQEDLGDAGHAFEAACKPDYNGGHFRAVVEGPVGQYQLVSSIEVDAVKPSEGQPQIKQFVELKTRKRNSSFTSMKNSSNWLQAYLAGIKSVVVGEKEETAKALRLLRVDSIKDTPIDQLLPELERARLFARLHRVLAFLAEEVKEGQLYALTRSRTTGDMELTAIKGGMDKHPIVTDELVKLLTKQANKRKAKCDSDMKTD